MNKLIISTICTFVLASMPLCAQEDPGKDLFLKYCKACHGEDGKAQTPMGKRLNIRDYTKAEVQAEFTDERIAQVIKEGITDDKGKKVMLPFDKKMSAEEITAVVAFIRTLKQ